MLRDVRATFALIASGANIQEMAVCKDGHFYRGYMPDLCDFDDVDKEIHLSQNGIMNFLPDGLFVNEEWLRQVNNDKEKLKQRIEQLNEMKRKNASFFKAFDTVFFQQELQLAQKVRQAEINMDGLMLRCVYGIDLANIQNPYIRKLAVLLNMPHVKGDVKTIGFFVRGILGERLEIERKKMSADTYAPSLLFPYVRFVILIEGLSTAEYLHRMDLYEEFFAFLQEWLLPFDCECDYCIKDRKQRFVLGESLTLDYNTQLA